MWNLPGPGIEPMLPVLAGRFFTTGAPGKSTQKYSLFKPPWVTIIVLLHLHTRAPVSQNHFSVTVFIPWCVLSLKLLVWQKHSDPVLMMFHLTRSHHNSFWTFYCYLSSALLSHLLPCVLPAFMYLLVIYLDLRLLEVNHCTFYDSWYMYYA